MRHTGKRHNGNGKDQRRVVFYSHDTFGLGHLRRSRTLATALTARDDTTSAIILTGSPVAGRFTFPERVDHIRLPGVTKLTDGSYVSQTLGLDIDDTTSLRAGLIQTAIEQYEPDLLIVDKEPTGFRGELLPTLEWLRIRGRTRTVLGLRDVLDEPEVLAAEWARKGAVAAAVTARRWFRWCSTPMRRIRRSPPQPCLFTVPSSQATSAKPLTRVLHASGAACDP